MDEVVIKVEQLSKVYRLGTINHGTLKRDLQSWWARLRGKDDPNTILSALHPSNASSSMDENFLALKDVTFDVKKGQVVGIIGRNGAGKSTLLKIFSRVTAPSAGTVKIKGRVASLLEVGTGFHPELTGRENIYLNGAILGMTQAEIKRKFEEIVTFAEIEQFIDTPVKRYSSGMYVRLAFAVAAHLEPEILIVDEVLAVGDAQFQKKCLGKMEDISTKEKRTILFVSHNMPAVQHLCTSCILLKRGEILAQGKTNNVIDKYLSTDDFFSSELEFESIKDRRGSGDLKFKSMRFQNEHNKEISSFRCGEAACFEFEIVNLLAENRKNVIVAIGIDNNMGQRIAVISNDISGETIDIKHGKSTIKILVRNLLLTPGRFYFTLFLSANGTITDWIQNAGYFTVEASNYYGSGKLGQDQGYLLLNYEYNLQ